MRYPTSSIASECQSSSTTTVLTDLGVLQFDRADDIVAPCDGNRNESEKKHTGDHTDDHEQKGNRNHTETDLGLDHDDEGAPESELESVTDLHRETHRAELWSIFIDHTKYLINNLLSFLEIDRLDAGRERLLLLVGVAVTVVGHGGIVVYHIIAGGMLKYPGRRRMRYLSHDYQQIDGEMGFNQTPGHHSAHAVRNSRHSHCYFQCPSQSDLA